MVVIVTARGTEVVDEVSVSEAGRLHTAPAGAFADVQVKLTTPAKLDAVSVKLYVAVCPPWIVWLVVVPVNENGGVIVRVVAGEVTGL